MFQPLQFGAKELATREHLGRHATSPMCVCDSLLKLQGDGGLLTFEHKVRHATFENLCGLCRSDDPLKHSAAWPLIDHSCARSLRSRLISAPAKVFLTPEDETRVGVVNRDDQTVPTIPVFLSIFCGLLPVANKDRSLTVNVGREARLIDFSWHSSTSKFSRAFYARKSKESTWTQHK